jgi:Ni,Fe-hydrogenase III small subunit
LSDVGALRNSCWVYVLADGERPALDGADQGVREVFSARHADALLVCGTPSEAGRKRLAAAFRGMASPRLAFLLDASGAEEAVKEVDSGAVVIELRSPAGNGPSVVAEMAEVLGKAGAPSGAAGPAGGENRSEAEAAPDEKKAEE